MMIHAMVFFSATHLWLDCDSHVEADFFLPGTELSRKELCCPCAGMCDSLIELNSSLKAAIGPCIFGGPPNLYDVP